MTERLQNMAELGAGEGRPIQDPPTPEAAAKLQRLTNQQSEFRVPDRVSQIHSLTPSLIPMEQIVMDMDSSVPTAPPVTLGDVEQVWPEEEGLRILGGATFKETIYFIDNLQNQPESPERNWVLEKAIERRNQLLIEANERYHLFDDVKAYLLGIYYDSRVKISEEEKQGRDEYKRMGGGKLQELALLRARAQQESWEAGVSPMVDAQRSIYIEGRPSIWSDPAHPERGELKSVYGGIVDYVNRESMQLIEEVVKDRKKYQSIDEYPKNGILSVWKGELIDNTGRKLLNEDGTVKKAEDFDDVRDAIEEERRKNPTISNRGDYEAWVRFAAEDAEELEEMLPDLVDRARKNIGSPNDDPNEAFNALRTEKTKLEKAAANFPEMTKRSFRRLKSELTSQIKLIGAAIFSKVVRKDWEPAFHFQEYIAGAFKDDEEQDHFVDSAILDSEGNVSAALEEYATEDGIHWRYGKNHPEMRRNIEDMSAFQQWQEADRARIEEKLMSRKLKSMSTLLNLDPQTGVSLGEPIHPAFQRLKVKLEQWDQEDRDRYGSIVDVSRRPTTKTRWQEYCEKAFKWQTKREIDDPRARPRVIFQHPLARAFRNDPIMDAQGNRVAENEFDFMFEADTRMDKLYRSVKRRKVRNALDMAERVQIAFWDDVAAGGPRHWFRDQAELAEIRKYLPVADLNEVVPHQTLIRAMLQKALRHDAERAARFGDGRRRFKLYHILTDKLGLDIDSPMMGSWYLGSHDSGRPVLMHWIAQVPEFMRILARKAEIRGKNADDQDGGDEKTTEAGWSEDERRFVLLTEYVARKKFSRYFNYPGHDTDNGGGKDQRNANYPAYGISRGTVRINGLIEELWPGVHNFAKDWGCTVSPWKQMMGLFKGPDEVVFMQTGYNGLIANPRDPESWVKRLKGSVNQTKIWTKGDKEGSGLLNDGPFSGMYLFRALNRDIQNFPNQAKDWATKNPEEAYKQMYESTFKAYVEVSGKVISPLMAVMNEIMKSEDSNYGRSPGSAMFLNTLLWLSVSHWMDTNWVEMREKFGFALDGDLHLARKFMHTVLYESGLIYTDEQWDEIVLGYTRVEKSDGTVERVVRYKVDDSGNTVRVKHDNKGNIVKEEGVVQGEIYEGLLDSFDPDLRREIIESQSGDNPWLPFGLNTEFPENMELLVKSKREEKEWRGEDRSLKNIYEGILSLEGQTRSRKRVIRPI